MHWFRRQHTPHTTISTHSHSSNSKRSSTEKKTRIFALVGTGNGIHFSFFLLLLLLFYIWFLFYLFFRFLCSHTCVVVLLYTLQSIRASGMGVCMHSQYIIIRMDGFLYYCSSQQSARQRIGVSNKNHIHDERRKKKSKTIWNLLTINFIDFHFIQFRI